MLEPQHHGYGAEAPLGGFGGDVEFVNGAGSCFEGVAYPVEEPVNGVVGDDVYGDDDAEGEALGAAELGASSGTCGPL
jgi:hypothetical protein